MVHMYSVKCTLNETKNPKYHSFKLFLLQCTMFVFCSWINDYLIGLRNQLKILRVSAIGKSGNNLSIRK